MRSDFLNISSGKFGDGADINDHAMELQYKEKIVLLEDQGAAGAIRSALTMEDSGTHFIVPALTSGTQYITLPAVSQANVGFTCKFTMIGTAGQVFSVDTAASADKIITWEPDGDGSGNTDVNDDGDVTLSLSGGTVGHNGGTSNTDGNPIRSLNDTRGTYTFSQGDPFSKTFSISGMLVADGDTFQLDITEG